MKELLTQMFTGWKLHEASYDHQQERYTRSEEECMIEACGDDYLKGHLLVLFGHWSNDIQSFAAHYGVGFSENGMELIEIPPAPSLEHWWNKGHWNAPNEEVAQFRSQP